MCHSGCFRSILTKTPVRDGDFGLNPKHRSQKTKESGKQQQLQTDPNLWRSLSVQPLVRPPVCCFCQLNTNTKLCWLAWREKFAVAHVSVLCHPSARPIYTLGQKMFIYQHLSFLSVQISWLWWTITVLLWDLRFTWEHKSSHRDWRSRILSPTA